MATSAQFEPVLQSKLDFFKKSRVQVTQVGYERIFLQPHNAVTAKTKRIVFRHPGKNTDYYRFMGHMTLDLDMKVADSAGAAIAADKEAGLINYFNQTCIDSVEIKLNETYITKNTRNYAYRSYIEALMSGNKLDAEGALAAAGFYLDEGNDVKADKADNSGFLKRFNLVKGATSVCTIGRLHTDIGRTELFLPNGLDLEVVITLNPDKFTLMCKADNTGEISLVSASLGIEICHINPAVLTAHARVFQDSNCVIPFQHVEVRTESVASGLKSVQLDNIVSGPLPSVILMGMVENNQIGGNILQNSLAFKHLDLSTVTFNVNGRPMGVGVFDFKSTPMKYAAAYQSLLASTGLLRSNESCLISYDKYPHGYTLIGVDLSTDGESAANHTHTSMQRVGNVGATISFDTNLATAVTFIFYCLWEGCTLEIDKFRNVFVSF